MVKKKLASVEDKKSAVNQKDGLVIALRKNLLRRKKVAKQKEMNRGGKNDNS